jgi:hypothetical protein
LPEGCALSADQNVSVNPIAISLTNKAITRIGLPKRPDALFTTIEVPCAPNMGALKRPVRYDFSSLGDALGDTTGGYQNTLIHPAPTRGCSGDDPTPPVLCTSVAFTAPEEAKFGSSYDLTWRLSPVGCIPHNGNEKVMPVMFGYVRATVNYEHYERLYLDDGPGWRPLDGKATIDVPPSKMFCSGEYEDLGAWYVDDRSQCDLFRIGAVGSAGTCEGLRIPPELSCP